MQKNSYCISRFQAKRNLTRVVKVGPVSIGGSNPIRIQSMTTTPTQDVAATAQQAITLAESGCEIVRITAQNVDAAKALKDIRLELNKAKLGHIPLVADIHFLPKAAMEAVNHVEKVRINPGNYADKKKFATLEYSDAQYEEELQRLYEVFSPLVLRAKELGKALRIGTNHGSLSDRIMNRYGDTPLGMVESALEFIRIAESHGYHSIIPSMKASNPKVMIQAYRLAVAKMKEEGMNYPLHLGVTEAGDGEDARIKSAIGIGSLLADGIGDTIRVSLTEDPVYEIPIARDLADIAHKLWKNSASRYVKEGCDAINPYEYTKREICPIELTPELSISSKTLPPVIINCSIPLDNFEEIVKQTLITKQKLPDNPIEALLLKVNNERDLEHLHSLQKILLTTIPVFVLDLSDSISIEELDKFDFLLANSYILCKQFTPSDSEVLQKYLKFTQSKDIKLAIDCNSKFIPHTKDLNLENTLFTSTKLQPGHHPLGTYRALAQALGENGIISPLWVRCTVNNTINLQDFFNSRLLESCILAGNLFCDGLGDILSVETENDLARTTALTYNILQGARMRSSKTEFVACPSCGRTLFDLQKTTQAIRAKTGHLKGVTIAIMGCIVNGPGEMADADFGYVGGAPGKINLYVGKECIQYNILQEHAVDKLIELIQNQGMWIDPSLASI